MTHCNKISKRSVGEFQYWWHTKTRSLEPDHQHITKWTFTSKTVWAKWYTKWYPIIPNGSQMNEEAVERRERLRGSFCFVCLLAFFICLLVSCLFIFNQYSYSYFLIFLNLIIFLNFLKFYFYYSFLSVPLGRILQGWTVNTKGL